MAKTAVIGLQYGDEGKGRVVGYFSHNYTWSVRFNGGPNAGHTVYDKKGNVHKLHHLPAGAVFGKRVALHAGMVINPETFIEECEKLNWKFPLYISEAVHLIQPQHVTQDANGSGIGSTKRGIAYVYSDRALRKGKRVGDDDEFFKKLKAPYKCCYKGLPPMDPHDTAIFEGAQGIMLDIDYGAYPYVSSSNIIPSAAHKIDKTIGVMKAYTTRVGDGPPYTSDIESLRNLGQEFGTTTGRPRRCTWNDIDQIKYALSVVQPDEIVVTKLDILKYEDSIAVYKGDELYTIGNLDNYKTFLTETFPQVKWFSEAPDGDLIRV
jgi:adenylosuccinate synthase